MKLMNSIVLSLFLFAFVGCGPALTPGDVRTKFQGELGAKMPPGFEVVRWEYCKPSVPQWMVIVTYKDINKQPHIIEVDTSPNMDSVYIDRSINGPLFSVTWEHGTNNPLIKSEPTSGQKADSQEFLQISEDLMAILRSSIK